MANKSDLEITCACGRCTLTIRGGKTDLRNPHEVANTLALSCNLACGCGVVPAVVTGPKMFPKELEDHINEWTALDWDDKLVGFGKTPEACIESAKANGYPIEKISLYFVPPPGIRV